jgi:hypothetical protein
MNADQAAMDPNRDIIRFEHFLGVPVLGVIERLHGLGRDKSRRDADVGLTLSRFPSPSPDITKHATVQFHHESVGQDPFRL